MKKVSVILTSDPIMAYIKCRDLGNLYGMSLDIIESYFSLIEDVHNVERGNIHTLLTEIEVDVTDELIELIQIISYSLLITLEVLYSYESMHKKMCLYDFIDIAFSNGMLVCNTETIYLELTNYDRSISTNK